MPDDKRTVDKLGFPSSSARQPLLHRPADSKTPSRQSSHAIHFIEQVAEGIEVRDRARIKRQLVKYGSFAWAILSSLCGGSITTYSLYGHLFQSRLGYTQYQVNIVSTVAELALYLPVPLLGLLCDRRGPGLASFLSALLFGPAYFIAAFAYRSGPPTSVGGNGWPFAVMVLAFAGIGTGTVSMYIAAVTTCAKNFGRGKHKGVALAAPIASFGLGGMWQSQFGTRVLYETNPDGTSGDVDVFQYFLFLGGLLLAVGLIGSVFLRVVDEEEMIDEAVEELERSGLLEDSAFFRQRHNPNGYGTMSDVPDGDMSENDNGPRKNQLLHDKHKKAWLLNEETRRFLCDRTMWWLAAGFFLVTGPGEAFINNVGTVIGTLSTSTQLDQDKHGTYPTTAATHISIIALTSTFARILSGTLSDLLAPVAVPHQHRRGPASLSSSLVSLDPLSTSRVSMLCQGRLMFSRVYLLLFSALLLSLGQALLASGIIQDHADRFWIVSALIGTGYGACFSLAPLIVACVWGVENFGTNWGVVAIVPAAGAAIWGAIYATVYEGSTADDGKCYGVRCYQSTFWAMAVCAWIACVLWIWAWRGPGGWCRRGIAV